MKPPTISKTRLLALCTTLAMPLSANAIESLQLTDTIKSNGTGNINLFKDLDAIALEQYRQDNNGFLVLGVDINEAASGTEKASSQGITLSSVVMTVEFDDGSSVVYDSAADCCFTESQTLVAEASTTTRQLYYSLLGETGSSRITANNAVQGVFDSTLKIEAPDSFYLADGRKAVSADIQILLLETNESLGDPEAFYDYSAGFEDLAVLNAVDTQFIDSYAAGMEEAPTVILTNPPPVIDPLAVTTWNYFPSASSFYVVGYEDLYPFKGDYDFNDLTVGYQAQFGLNADGDVVAIQGVAYLITRGSSYNHDWALKIGLPASVTASQVCTTYLTHKDPSRTQSCSLANDEYSSGSIDLVVFEETRTIFPDPAGSLFVNSQKLHSPPWYLKFFKGPKSEFRIDFDAPVAVASIQSAPFDPYLHVIETARDVHLLEVDAAYQDDNGYPFGMLVVDNWKPPLEYMDTGIAYPFFDDFVASKGARSQAWHQTYNQSDIVDIPESVEIPDSSVWAW